jgi:hypothetical protein
MNPTGTKSTPRVQSDFSSTIHYILKPRQNKKSQTFVVMLGFCMSFLQQATDENTTNDWLFFILSEL